MTDDRPPHTSSLVSSRRFGAALLAARTAQGATLAALSRRCDGWWLPDELAELEKGAAPLGDAQVLSLARLYRVPGAAIAAPGAAELVLDRSTSTDVDDAVEPVDDPRAVAARLVALSTILGLDPEGIGAPVVVAEGLGGTTAEVRSALVEAADAAVTTAAALEGRVVVPITGILVASTRGGSIVLTRPAGRQGRRRKDLPTAAPLRSLVARARQAA